MNIIKKEVLYPVLIIWVAAMLTLLVGGMIKWEMATAWISALWVIGFFLVSINIGYLVVTCIGSYFVPSRLLLEKEDVDLPLTAILYVVKNEDSSFHTRMCSSLESNSDENIHLWLISNSDQPEYELKDKAVVAEFQEKFGSGRVFMFRDDESIAGMKHISTQRWAKQHTEYTYFIVCDADTELYSGSVSKLVSKAEHPSNSNIAIFQTHMQICESKTRFALFLEPGQNIVQKVICAFNYAVLNRSPYYGHGALIRREVYAGLNVPSDALSHDYWETADTDRQGWSVAFCHDVKSAEMFPVNYIEYKRRSRRWILGTLETIPLITDKSISLGTRFYIALGSYVFLVQPVFLIWIGIGLLAHNSLAGSLMKTQSVWLGGSAALDFEMGGVSAMTLGFVWLYKTRFCSSMREVRKVMLDVIMGTLLLLNNLLYDSFVVIASPWLSRKWIPMSKKVHEQLSYWECFRKMFPNTLIGVGLLVLGLLISKHWTLATSPVIISFMFCSILVFWTSKQV